MPGRPIKQKVKNMRFGLGGSNNFLICSPYAQCTKQRQSGCQRRERGLERGPVYTSGAENMLSMFEIRVGAGTLSGARCTCRCWCGGQSYGDWSPNKVSAARTRGRPRKGPEKAEKIPTGWFGFQGRFSELGLIFLSFLLSLFFLRFPVVVFFFRWFLFAALTPSEKRSKCICNEARRRVLAKSAVKTRFKMKTPSFAVCEWSPFDAKTVLHLHFWMREIGTTLSPAWAVSSADDELCLCPWLSWLRWHWYTDWHLLVSVDTVFFVRRVCLVVIILPSCRVQVHPRRPRNHVEC